MEQRKIWLWGPTLTPGVCSAGIELRFHISTGAHPQPLELDITTLSTPLITMVLISQDPYNRKMLCHLLVNEPRLVQGQFCCVL